MSDLDIDNFEIDFMIDDEIIEKEIKPYEKFHILLSYSKDHLIEVNKVLEQVRKIKGVEKALYKRVFFKKRPSI